MIKSAAIKAAGYAISTLSVVLLGIVSWESAQKDTTLALCLAAGMLTSIMGMALRWLSYRIEDGRKTES
jgi:hypothetical protein